MRALAALPPKVEDCHDDVDVIGTLTPAVLGACMVVDADDRARPGTWSRWTGALKLSKAGFAWA